MPIRHKGSRAPNFHGVAASKIWALQNILAGPNDIEVQRRPLPGGGLVAGTVLDLGNATVTIPDPDIVVMSLFPRAGPGGDALPRFFGTKGEIFRDVIAVTGAEFGTGVDDILYFFGAPRVIGGGWYCIPFLPDATFTRVGVLVFDQTGRIFAPRVWTVSSAFDFITLPAIDVCVLGERAPGVFAFVVSIQESFPVSLGKLFLFHTNDLGPDAGDEITLPPYVDDSRFPSHLAPLGPGEAIWLQRFVTPTQDPEIRYLFDYDQVDVIGHLSDIDAAWEQNHTRNTDGFDHFTRTADDSIMFVVSSQSGEAPRFFRSDSQGLPGSWEPCTPPIEPESTFDDYLTGNGYFQTGALQAFGEGCVMVNLNKITVPTGPEMHYTLDFGETWQELPQNGLPSPDFYYHPIVLRPYVNEFDKGEIAVIHQHQDEGDRRTVYVTTDLGENWWYRGEVVNEPGAADTTFGWNDIGEYIGTYDQPAPVYPAFPGLLEYSEAP